MKTLNALLDHAAQTAPSSAGLITGEEKISYADLKTRVLSIATALRARGINSGDRVAIIHRNSPVFIEAYFALSRLGAIAVPINYMIHNPEELAYMLNDCKALGVVTQKEFLKGVREAVKMSSAANSLWISDILQSECKKNEEMFSALRQTTPEDFPVSVIESDVATILYTAGTTGKPKGRNRPR